MFRTALLIACAVLLSCAARADVRRSSVPGAYRGKWLAANGSVIELSKKSYVSPAASCSVDSVSKIAGARGSIYSLRLRCVDSPAGKRVSSNLIIWPKDRDEIAVGPEFAKLVNFRRCAPGECKAEGESKADGEAKPRQGR